MPSTLLALFPAYLSLVSRIMAESKRLDSEEQDTEESFRAKRLALAKA